MPSISTKVGKPSKGGLVEALEDEDLFGKSEDLGEATPGLLETKFPLDVRKKEFSIFELHRRWRANELRLQPDFQRAFVWPEAKQVKLIESVLALIPLPVIYLSDDGEGLEVVDGQQRLTTLFAFMEGRFADPNAEASGVIRRREIEPAKGRPFLLRSLRLMKELEGKTFETLDPRTRRKFEETQLTCFILEQKTSPNAKFELFERINEGAVALNAQEIRNALLSGPGLDLVRSLGGPGSRFREVAGIDRRYARMRADELVLRGIAFLWRGWDDYKGDLKDFLNDSLEKLNKTSVTERADVEKQFLHGVDFAERIFEGKAWQRYDPKTNEWSGHISGPLVEVVSTAANRVFPGPLPSDDQASRICERFQELCGDVTFTDAILSATQTVRNVKARMEAFERICRDVV